MEGDLGQLNIGLASAWRKAAIREDWLAHCGHSNAPGEYGMKEECHGHMVRIHFLAPKATGL